MAASNDGKDSPPAWFLNLSSNPQVDVQIGREHLTGTATIIESSDPEYGRLRELMNRTNHRRYGWYRSNTTRPIALVGTVPASYPAYATRRSQLSPNIPAISMRDRPAPTAGSVELFGAEGLRHRWTAQGERLTGRSGLDLDGGTDHPDVGLLGQDSTDAPA